jgi:biofilm protein TabA
MILDAVDHIERYAGLNDGLAAGLAFLAKAGALPDGRHVIDGEKIYAVISSYQTREKSVPAFEAHRRYIDIQCMLSGRESQHWMPRGTCKVRQDYSGEKDLELLADGEGSEIVLEPGMFVVYFPQDAHRPGCIVGQAEAVRKVVVKVLEWQPGRRIEQLPA